MRQRYEYKTTFVSNLVNLPGGGGGGVSGRVSAIDGYAEDGWRVKKVLLINGGWAVIFERPYEEINK